MEPDYTEPLNRIAEALEAVAYSIQHFPISDVARAIENVIGSYPEDFAVTVDIHPTTLEDVIEAVNQIK